ncbi:peroxiredoxin [Arthrospiribacter ruber]|uniref:thioredoxin-dependent peroxiredoxin n=1 Tax=Arthrospiribacter ruber TaxID=2487934 RepID=A0A951IVI4_9BACT|nr:peroxiredoxin [Arthrospiribacter ruber]MBW3467975.1 peroxiredoxin [Arthrospiribacter ruber]
MALKIGTKAPDFTLPSTSGEKITLSVDCKGKACIVYFYPKDFTRVCSKEACDFRDQFAAFRNLDIPIFGISRDDMKTHLRFKDEYQLPFDLLSDLDGRVCKSYDALVPLIKMPKRITYFLDQDHIIKGVHSEMFESSSHVSSMLKLIK